MSGLSSMNFVLPAESGEKASFGVTLFLSQIVFSVVVQGYMPVQSSSIPHLSEFDYFPLRAFLNFYSISVDCINELSVSPPSSYLFGDHKFSDGYGNSIECADSTSPPPWSVWYQCTKVDEETDFAPNGKVVGIV